MTGPAVVTGASSGIGLAVVRALLAEGREVVGLSRRAPEGLGPRYGHVSVDLEDADAFAAALEALPPAGAAVHAAGMLRVGAHDAFDREEGARMWRLHVDAAAQLIGALAPRMAEGGRIVLLGSRLARGAPGRGLYAASKAALPGLARSVAAELAPRGITVNVVAPGATDTPMLRDPARAAVPPKLPPIGRLIDPGEVAALVAFLLSPAAGAITGQEIVVCGGASL